MPAANSTPRSTRPPAACTASASRWSTRCRSGSRSRSRAARSSTGRRSSAAIPKGKLEDARQGANRRGTAVRFKPGRARFSAPRRAFQAGAPVQDGALQGLSVRRRRNPLALRAGAAARASSDVPAEAVFHFPGGLKDYLAAGRSQGDTLVHPRSSPANRDAPAPTARCEWAVAWTADADGFLSSYCNTIPTPDGGTHESGLRTALLRGLKDHAERVGQGKRAASITSEDVMASCAALLSVFIREPEFQGQTKDRLATAEAAAHRRAGDQGPVRPLAGGQSARRPTSCSTSWSSAPRSGCAAARKRTSPARPRGASCACPASSPTAPTPPRKARNCSSSRAIRPAARAKQARDRETQAILPLRGKILNVATATQGQAGGEPAARRPDAGDRLRHRRALPRRGSALRAIIIMTDADVDGAHIASLLITFFYRQMPRLIDDGHLYLAVPPLYRLTHGGKTVLCPRRRAPGRAIAEERIQRQRQGRGRPLQGPRRNDAGAAQGNHHGPDASARCCAWCCWPTTAKAPRIRSSG